MSFPMILASLTGSHNALSDKESQCHTDRFIQYVLLVLGEIQLWVYS